MNTLAQIDITLPDSLTDPNIAIDLVNSDNFLGTLLSRALLLAITLAGMYFLVRLISAGYRLLTAQGDPGKIQGANQELTTSFTGLLIIVSAFFITQVVQTILGIRLL